VEKMSPMKSIIILCVFLTVVSSFLSRLIVNERLGGSSLRSTYTASSEASTEEPKRSFFYSKKDFSSIGLNLKVMGGVLNALNLGNLNET
jgi:hypothetical protein